MGFWSFFTLLCLIGFYVNWYGTTKALRLNANISEGGSKLPSLPSYYGTHSFLWLIIPVITFLIIWFFFKPYIMDFFLNKYISLNMDDSFTGDPSMLIDTVKATDPEKVFPGTNPL
ncbi:MAG: phosphate ABC transporter permease family protein, partial [Alphaproteobacteria bacterium]